MFGALAGRSERRSVICLILTLHLACSLDVKKEMRIYFLQYLDR